MPPDTTATTNLSTPPAQQHEPANDQQFTEFSDRPGFNFTVAICWLAVIAAILATIFFWFMDKNSAGQLKAATSKKTDIVNQLKSPANTEVENKANDFKSSVNALSEAKNNSRKMSTFLQNFYTKITSDVILTSIAVSSDGSLGITGTTATYRSVADLMLALKSWDVLSSVELGAVSDQKDAKTGKVITSFSITAKVNQNSTTTSTSAGGTQ